MRRTVIGLAVTVLLWSFTFSSVQASEVKHFYDFKKSSLKDSRGKGPDIIIPEVFLQNMYKDGYCFFQQESFDNPVYPGPALSSEVISSDNYRIGVRFKLAQASLDWWHKLIDPWNLDPVDNGIYVLNGKITFWNPALDPGGTNPWGISGPKVISPETFVELLITRDAESKMFSVYLDGELQIEFEDTSGWMIFSRGLIWFFTDDHQTLGGEGTTGCVDWIKIYK